MSQYFKKILTKCFDNKTSFNWKVLKISSTDVEKEYIEEAEHCPEPEESERRGIVRIVHSQGVAVWRL